MFKALSVIATTLMLLAASLNAQVLVNQSGYNTAGSKRFTAPLATDGTPFSIVTQPGAAVVFSGTVNSGVGDFTAFEPAASGDFRVLLGNEPTQESSHVFGIGPFWIERVSYHRMIQFFIDSRSGFGDATTWTVTNGKFGSGIAWRDSHQFSFELRTLIQWYAANPDAFGTDRMPIEGTYNGLRDTLPANTPEIVRLIHWGVDLYLRGNLNHTLIKEELAYFLYYYPLFEEWIPVSLYNEARDYLFPLWGNTARDRWNWYDISHTANLFQTYTTMGGTKGSFPPGHSIVPNLLMHAVALRESRADAATYLTAARNQTQWIVNNLDPSNPIVTKGQRMSEHILVPALAEFMMRDPSGPVTGVDAWLANWTDTAIARSDNYWDFRKYSDTIWTPENPGSTSHPWWNEPGNVAGFPASALSAATRISDPAKIDRLRAIAVSQTDQVFGRNPHNRHYSFRATQPGYGFEGVETGWFSQHLGGLGILENSRGVLDASAKQPAFPYNPSVSPGYVEGWVAFNSAWNAAMVWSARDRSSIKFLNRDTQGAVGGTGIVEIELQAPLNFNRSLAETATIRISSADADEETLVLTETGTDTSVFRGTISLLDSPTPTAGNGTLEAETGTKLTAGYAHDVFERTSTAAAFESTSATWQWDGGTATSNWQTPANWNPDTAAAFFGGSFSASRLNVNGSQALEYSAAEGTTHFAGDTSDAPVFGRGLVIGSGAFGSGTMNITGGSFSTAGSLAPDVVGNNDGNTGTLNISGGSYISGAPGTSLGLGGGIDRVSNLALSGSGAAVITSLAINTGTANVNLDGGTLEINGLVNTFIGTAATIRLNGGTLKAGQSNPAFIPVNGKLETLVQSGGATIDTNSFDVTIAEPLLEDPLSPGGGLEKNGAGLLTLSALSTASGDVAINAGGLAVKGDTLVSWLPASFTHSGDTLNFDLGSVDPSNPAPISTGALTVNSAVTVNVTGSNYSIGEFPLIQYSIRNITGSLTLNAATLPPGIVANIADDGIGMISLNITALPVEPPVDDNFDSGTGSWFKAVTGTTGTLTNDAGRLRWSEGNGSNMGEVIGRSFDPQTLAVGDTIRLTFDFTWSAGSGNILRAGLFNVANPIAADNWAGANAIGAWEGYYTFVRDASSTGNIARRDAASSASGSSGPTNGGTNLATENTNFNINDNATVIYQVIFDVTYVSPTQMNTLLTLKEGETTRFSVPGSTSVIYDTFNTVVFKTGANGPTSYFDNVRVELISPVNGFDSWIAGTFAGGQVPGGQRGPGDDPDNDGVANLLEFVLNGDPTIPDPGSLPALDVTGGNLVFTYTRRDDSISPETTQIFQHGSDLTGWTDVVIPAGDSTVGAATIDVTDGDPADTVVISIPFSQDGGSGRLFGRLRVSSQ